MPKTFVVDASTTLKWIFDDEQYSQQALHLLQKWSLQRKIDLITPNIWVFEVANAIRTAFVRKRLNSRLAKNKFNQLLDVSPYLVNIEPEMDICLKNSFKYNISVYDSAYITLAIANRTTLISSDSKLIRSINNPKIAVSLRGLKPTTSTSTIP